MGNPDRILYALACEPDRISIRKEPPLSVGWITRMLVAWAFVMIACCNTTVRHASGTTITPGPTHDFPWSPDPPAGPAMVRAASIAALGQRLFQDPALSTSGRMACATCHDPAHGFGPTNALAVQRGGPNLNQPSIRAVPGLTYLAFHPVFAEHFHAADDEGDESIMPVRQAVWPGMGESIGCVTKPEFL